MPDDEPARPCSRGRGCPVTTRRWLTARGAQPDRAAAVASLLAHLASLLPVRGSAPPPLLLIQPDWTHSFHWASGPDSSSGRPLQPAFFTRGCREQTTTATHTHSLDGVSYKFPPRPRRPLSAPLFSGHRRGLAHTPSLTRDRCAQQPTRWWSASGLPGTRLAEMCTESAPVHGPQAEG